MDPVPWFRDLPIVSRSFLVASLGTTLAVSFGLVDIRVLMLDGIAVMKRYQLWRLLTSTFLFGRLSFHVIMELFMVTQFGSQLERSPRFRNGSADYVFFLLTVSILSSVASIAWEYPTAYPICGPAVVNAVIFYWSKFFENSVVSIYMFRVKGAHLPYALAVLTLLLGGSIAQNIIGCLVGYAFYAAKDGMIAQGLAPLIDTPMWFVSWFNSLVSTRGNEGSSDRSTGSNIRTGGSGSQSSGSDGAPQARPVVAPVFRPFQGKSNKLGGS